jgi:tripartite-type tricarboxylate transporter receptor subunit TctC
MSKILAIVVCATAFFGPVQAAEQRYPTRPIRVIIPTGPGGGSDQIVRSLGQKFTAAWGQPVVVDHRPGAGQTIGIEIGAKATPDGHTLVMTNPSHAINATLYTKLPYDPVRDLTPVTVLVTQSYGVIVPNSLPVKSVKDMIALVKAKPREINFASSGNGSASHLAGELFVHMAGVEMTHIPYKGTGTVMPDLIAGRVSFYINPMLAVINQVQAKQVRLLAVTSLKRVSALPDVPTVAESGVPGYEATSWYMMLAPAKTPAAIVNQLDEEVVKALKADDMREMMARAGVEPLGNSPREAMEFLKAEIAKWGKVIRMAKVKID